MLHVNRQPALAGLLCLQLHSIEDSGWLGLDLAAHTFVLLNCQGNIIIQAGVLRARCSLPSCKPSIKTFRLSFVPGDVVYGCSILKASKMFLEGM